MSVEKNGKSRLRKEYEQGFFFSIGVLVTGMLIEWATRGMGTGLPAWPLNAQIGISFIVILLFIHIYYRDMSVFNWLSRIPAAISAISLFTLLVLVMGLSTQNNPDASNFMKYTGLSHVRNSYAFLLSGLFLLTTLGLVALKRAIPFNFKNIGFLLNHLGLWIIVFAGSLGAGDMKRLSIYVNEGETVWFGVNANNSPSELPFMIKLFDFSIEEFNPKLAYIKSKDMSFPEGVNNNMRLIEDGSEITIDNWKVEIKEFIKTSLRDSTGYYFSQDTMAMPAARIHATHLSIGTNVIRLD
jgi:hypothetical protein